MNLQRASLTSAAWLVRLLKLSAGVLLVIVLVLTVGGCAVDNYRDIPKTRWVQDADVQLTCLWTLEWEFNTCVARWRQLRARTNP